MAYTLTVDGDAYPHIGVSNMTRSASIMEDGNSGWTLNGVYQRSIIGTLYNYSFTLYQLGEAYAEEYDELYQLLTAPQASHTFVLPYGQSTITITGYITGTSDVMRWDEATGRLWGALAVSVQAKQPSRTTGV